MKKYLILLGLLCLLSNLTIWSRDIILLKNGEEFKAIVTEISNNEIRYKKFENPEGPTIVVPRNEVFVINYQNGTREIINTFSNNTSTPAAVPVPAKTSSVVNLKASGGDEYPISRFAISVNPLGLLQFGPIINMEFGLSKSVVLNTHVRFPTLGALAYAAHEIELDDDKFRDIAFGGGLLFFPGKKQSKPYFGFLAEYDIASKVLDVGESYERNETDNILVFMGNAGYRFRFDSGFYINTGVLFGIAISNWEKWYTDESYYDYDGNEQSGTDRVPFGMLELTFGYEF